jgi:hypothetical protein
VTCTFTTVSSALRLCFLGICAEPVPVAGELDVRCGAGTDARDCACLFRSFEPVEISGVGFACIDPADGACPSGTQDCDGSTSVSIDLVADSDIGTCSSNSECASKCDAYCGALEPAKVRYSSGCENYCQAGARLDLPCICDVATGGTCEACKEEVCTGSGQACTTDADCLGVNDCPFGGCEGRDNELDVDCHCQCTDEAFGNRTAAGGLNCRLPIAIRVESSSDCDSNGLLVLLPPLCAPLTTGEASGILLQLNETSNPLEFDSLRGASTTCAAFDGGDATGMTFVANLGFFDSTIGDVISQLTLQCE